MKEIVTNNGKIALVDDEDAALVAAYRWCAREAGVHRKIWYVFRSVSISGRDTSQYLHRFLMDAPQGMHVDHIDGDGLNNRRSNLRLCTRSQNMANSRRKVSASGWRGVYLQSGGWRVRIQSGAGKCLYGGTFPDPITAAKAYDDLAVSIFGEFARLNFPKEPSP